MLSQRSQRQEGQIPDDLTHALYKETKQGNGEYLMKRKPWTSTTELRSLSTGKGLIGGGQEELNQR